MRFSIGCFAALLIACSSDNSTDAGSEGGALQDSGGGNADGAVGKDSGGMDAMTSMDSTVADAGLHGCTSFDDRTGPQAMRTITWQFNPSPKCIEISAGQSVTWQGDFGFHPLEPLGGTTPTPIMTTANGSSATFAFPNPGFYGYHCAVHSGLEGVVHVK